MNEWKFKVGDSIKDDYRTYLINATCLEYGIQHYILTDEHKKTIKLTKNVVEELFELVKPKSLFEQALALIGLEVEQEFEFKFVNTFGASSIYKFSSNGTLWNKTREGWQTTLYGLHTILTSGKLPKIHKPKSEAELILDELEKVVDKANEVLRKSGR